MPVLSNNKAAVRGYDSSTVFVGSQRSACYTRLTMGLTRDEVLHIAKLARLGLSDEDVPRFQEQLSEILDHFESLKALDTEGVPPTAHPLPLESVMRDDAIAPSLPVADVLANAPLTEGDAFRVRAVLDE